jgi:DNA-binding NarL/FixJ family response regulator
MIRLLLVDDQCLWQDGIKTMLNLEPDLQVIGTADHGEVAIQKAEALQPDVVLLDIWEPKLNGHTVTQVISERFPKTKVLILSACADKQHIVESMRAGAKGYLLKNMQFDELAGAIRFAARGYTQFAPGLFEKVLVPIFGSGSHDLALDKMTQIQLTPREQEVLGLVSTGATNQEIAQELFISEGTVKGYVTNLLNRLNLKNRVQLAVCANSVAWHDRPVKGSVKRIGSVITSNFS